MLSPPCQCHCAGDPEENYQCSTGKGQRRHLWSIPYTRYKLSRSPCPRPNHLWACCRPRLSCIWSAAWAAISNHQWGQHQPDIWPTWFTCQSAWCCTPLWCWYTLGFCIPDDTVPPYLTPGTSSIFILCSESIHTHFLQALDVFLAHPCNKEIAHYSLSDAEWEALRDFECKLDNL